jgi:hypothetical protein
LFVNSFFINALAQNVPAIEKTVRSSIWWNLSDQNARPLQVVKLFISMAIHMPPNTFFCGFAKGHRPDDLV